MSDQHAVTRQFEVALCEYTSARYAVAVNSCTMALTLAVAWCLRAFWGTVRDAYNIPMISIPQHTYVSVPMAIIHVDARPVFRDEQWRGAYQLKPLPVWDCARRFTSDMYVAGQYQCVSFHAAKILGDTQGGAILHDDVKADAWFRRARFDGRAEGVAPKDDSGIICGWHAYMSPDVSARLLNKLHFLPLHNEDLPNDDYPDLSTMECFR